VKQQCQEVPTQLIVELQGWFPTQGFIDALGIVYPQYWSQPKPEKRFNVHLAIIKATFYQPKKVGLDEVWVFNLFQILLLTFKNLCLCLA
jgi:hypothetical protein